MSETATQTRATRTTEAKHYGVFERHDVYLLPKGTTNEQMDSVIRTLGLPEGEAPTSVWLLVNHDVKADGSRDTDATRKSAVAAAVKDRPLEQQRATFATVPAGEWHEYAPPSNLWEA